MDGTLSRIASFLVRGEGSPYYIPSAVDSGGLGDARASPELEGSEKGRSLFSADFGVGVKPWIQKAIYGRRCWK